MYKRKTAYGMLISDWSSDVCSSDLLRPHAIVPALRLAQIHVEARQEIAPENVVRGAQHFQPVAAFYIEHLAREDHRLRRFGPVDEQDARLRLGNGNLEMLRRLRSEERRVGPGGRSHIRNQRTQKHYTQKP